MKHTVILSMLIKIKTSECRGIYVTNLNFRYKYQLFIPWTIFARLRLWNIESWRTFLFFFIAQRDICGGYRVTLKRSRSRQTLVLSLPSISFVSLVFRRPQLQEKNRAINKVGLWELSAGRWPALYHLISTVYNSSHMTADSDGKGQNFSRCL